MVPDAESGTGGGGEELNFLRLAKLVLEAAPVPLRALFESRWNATYPRDQWDGGSAAGRRASAALLLRGSAHEWTEIPGSTVSVKSRADMEKLLKVELPKLLEIRKFEPSNWVGVGDQVFFTVDWVRQQRCNVSFGFPVMA